MKKSIKFEDVDVLDALSKIVELHTRHYKEDFDLDKELIPKLALSPNPEDKHLLWMSRPSGTYVLRERDTYLDGTFEHNTWKYYHEQSNDSILAYAISLTGIQNGSVTGSIYPLDYASHVERVKQLALPLSSVTVTFEDGFAVTLPFESNRRRVNELMPKHGVPRSMLYTPESEAELSAILRREHFQREHQAISGNFNTYIRNLEKGSVHAQLKNAKSVANTVPRSHRKKDSPEL